MYKKNQRGWQWYSNVFRGVDRMDDRPGAILLGAQLFYIAKKNFVTSINAQ